MSYVYDFYTDKLDGLYMKRGVLPSVPGDWTLRASAFHPNHLVVRAVEWDGYCLRRYPARIDAQKFYGVAA
jgi:hypothetical protein